jgi:cell division topological specificity factor
MPEFLDRLFGRAPAKKTGTMAKERLQFILVHDRINLPPERMEAMKKEILEVIAKYVSVDDENVDIALQRRERDSLLVAEIPFLKTLEAIEPDDYDDERPESSGILPDDDPSEQPSVNQIVPEDKPSPEAEVPPPEKKPETTPPPAPAKKPVKKR